IPVNQSKASWTRSRTRRRGTWWRLSLIVIGAAGMLALSVLFLRAPMPLVERLAVSEADWLLSDYIETPTGLGAVAKNAGRKLNAFYLQYGMAAAIRARIRVERSRSDVERMMAVLVPLREAILNQREVVHQAGQWAPLFSGVG